MPDPSVCEWLLRSADISIRSRTARELLKDEAATKKLEPELLASPGVERCMKNLALCQGEHFAVHGSFDYCLENALLKALWLGLHPGIAAKTAAKRTGVRLNPPSICSC
ncbi:MAG: hypothetical protein PHD32_09565 [Eubacteriales bacterium]|nr:hypothetical protein [Eubacteriales bacterium]